MKAMQFEVDGPIEWAEVPDDPKSLDPAQVAENRDEWLTTWGEITTR